MPYATLTELIERIPEGVLIDLTDDEAAAVMHTSRRIAQAAGGWTLTWQGDGTKRADFPNADSISDGFRQQVGEENFTVAKA